MELRRVVARKFNLFFVVPFRKISACKKLKGDDDVRTVQAKKVQQAPGKTPPHRKVYRIYKLPTYGLMYFLHFVYNVAQLLQHVILLNLTYNLIIYSFSLSVIILWTISWKLVLIRLMNFLVSKFLSCSR